MSGLLLFVFLVFSAFPPSQTQTDVFAATDTVTGAPPINDFKREWYSRHLIAMGESRLLEGPGQSDLVQNPECLWDHGCSACSGPWCRDQRALRRRRFGTDATGVADDRGSEVPGRG
jgi:hypothetical protein